MVDIEVVDASAPPWPVVEDEDWRSTTTAFLPFLQWHEHVCLRPVGVPRRPSVAFSLARPETPRAYVMCAVRGR